MKRFAIVLALFGLAAAALAADDGTLSLSPAVIMLRGSAGQSTTQTFTLRNDTTRPFSFDLAAQDVVAERGQRRFFDAGKLAGSIAGTAVFSPRHVDVAPGSSATASVTVTLPRDAAGRAMLVLFRGTNVVMSGRVPMTASVGSLLTFTMSDEVALDATPLSVRSQSATANLGVTQTCTNAGREPLVATGMLAVLDANGGLVGRARVAPHRLVPGESAELGTEYAGELPSGRYKLIVTYDFEGKTLSRSAEVEVR